MPGGPPSARKRPEGMERQPRHNAVIINDGMWSRSWKAIGIGIYGNYAVVWFGNEEDPVGGITP